MGKAKRKKEDMWNLKNIIKIVPKIFLFDPRHISLHPTCLWHPRYLSKTIIWTYLISKNFYRDKRETTLIFWDPVSPPREVPLGPILGIRLSQFFANDEIKLINASYHFQIVGACSLSSQVSANIFWTSGRLLKLQKR